jgi:alkylation response protein AidB-like acyl-CoA dehydrogenase
MISWPEDGLEDWGDAAESFARARLVPGVRGQEKHADPSFPALLEEMREIGFTSLCADTRLEGLEQGVGALARVLEPIAAMDAGAAAAIYATAAAQLAITLSRVPSATLAGVPAADAGWLAWAAFAELDEQVWPTADVDGRVFGVVNTVLLASHAIGTVLPVRAPDGEIALVYVDLAADGVSRSAPVRMGGLAGPGCADLTFDGAPSTLLTRRGTEVFTRLQGLLSVASLAQLHGVMRASSAAAEDYAHSRFQGGGPIIGWGEVRRLVSLQQERLRAAGAIVSEALVAARTGSDLLSARYGALHVGSLATELTTDGVQLFGGNGYMQDFGQERRMRDARQLHCLTGGVAWRRQGLLAVALAPAAGAVDAITAVPAPRLAAV